MKRDRKTQTRRQRVNASALAREVGLSRQRVSRLLAEGYSPAAIAAKQKAKRALVAEDVKTGKPESWIKARSRKESILADTRAIELERLRGTLVDRAEVVSAIGDIIVHSRDRFLALAAELRDELDQRPGAECEAVLDRAVRRRLEDLARRLLMTVRGNGTEG